MKSLIAVLLITIAGAQAFAGADANYKCVLQGNQNELFDKTIRLELFADQRYLTFLGSRGDNCNGNLDPNYRQKFESGGDTTKYTRYYTDCEREEGFIQILLSEGLTSAADRAPLKMRIRGSEFFQQVYMCHKI